MNEITIFIFHIWLIYKFEWWSEVLSEHLNYFTNSFTVCATMAYSGGGAPLDFLSKKSSRKWKKFQSRDPPLLCANPWITLCCSFGHIHFKPPLKLSFLCQHPKVLHWYFVHGKKCRVAEMSVTGLSPPPKLRKTAANMCWIKCFANDTMNSNFVVISPCPDLLLHTFFPL